MLRNGIFQSKILPGKIFQSEVFQLALRNLLRNKKRSISCVLAISIAALVLSFMISLVGGMMLDLKRDIIRYDTGEIFIENIHKKELKRISSSSLNIDRTAAEELLRQAEQDAVLPKIAYILPQITSGAEAFRSLGTVVENPQTLALSLKGRDIEQEIAANQLDKLLLAGRFPHKNAAEVIVSQDLAWEMGLQLGDKLTFLASSTEQSQVFASYTVTGLLRSENSNLLRSAFMHIDELAEFLGMSGEAHRSNVVFAHTLSSDEGQALLPHLQAVMEEANASGMVARFWSSDSPLYSIFETSTAMMDIYSYFFFFLAGLVILNSALMSLYERRHELGILKALGSSNGNLRLTLLLEQLYLGLFGSLLGIGIAMLTAIILNASFGGLPLPATYQEQGFVNTTRIKLLLDPANLWKITLAALLSNCILTIYPILKTCRKKVSDLLYHSYR